MLLAGLHGHAQRLVAAPIYGDANDAAGGRAFVFIAGSKKGRVRTTKAHRYAKTLGVAHHNVSAQCAR